MAIKLEFDSNDKEAARVFGEALLEYAGDAPERRVHDDGTAGHMEKDKSTGGVLLIDDPCATQDNGDEIPNHVQAWAAERVETPVPVDVDHNGVIKDPRYVGESEDPFYASGKRKGQWKKKRGVDEGAYDKWYASQVAATPAPDQVIDEQIDTAGAFGSAPTGGEVPPPPVEDETIPTNCGEFMAWISEHQVAQRLTAEDISAAYTSQGLSVTDLFPPNNEEIVALHIKTLYDILSEKVGA